ncbi:MAG: hydroxyacid dehydrogenase [Planctomycetota bacterium]
MTLGPGLSPQARSNAERPAAVVCLEAEACRLIYGSELLAALAERVQLVTAPLTAEEAHSDAHALGDVELMFGGWGSPRLDAELLDRMPSLKMVFYGSGSIRHLMTEDAWDRGVRVCSSYAANAVPVAEFTMSQIVFCLKQGYRCLHWYREHHTKPAMAELAGAYGSTVGVVSIGMIGSMVCERLKAFDVNVIAYDPYASSATAERLGVKLVDLPELFAASDVVTLHTPSLDATRGMITGELIASMKRDASLINTSRGAVIDEPALVEVLRGREDLTAVLDVTAPEPVPAGSPLWSLGNVVLLPHIAGSGGRECRRMGQYMLDELHRYLGGQPLHWEIHREAAKIMA